MCEWLRPLALLPLVFATGSSIAVSAHDTTAAEHYSLADFQRARKIDAHVHVHGSAEHFMAQVVADNFRILTINTDYPDYPPVAEQAKSAVSLRNRFPGRVAFAGTFTVENFTSPDWARGAQQQIDAASQAGAVGVKLWKNIGMDLKDADGRYVMPDDSRIEPLIAALERDHLVLLGHQAEPLDCWLPFEKMAVRGDREYYTEHPQYYMYEHPEMPSHESILAARDRMLKAHPKLRFDAVHLASLEWDVDRIAKFLDTFPNASVDLAARLVHLEHQAIRNRKRVRQFFIRYQDRILYGTDVTYGPVDTDQPALDAVHSGWLEDWRFLVTADPMHSSEFDPAFRGVQLPKAVVDKIYWRNAEALFPDAWGPG